MTANSIPKNILKGNSKVFARFFHENMIFCTEKPAFLSGLKLVDHLKRHQILRKTTGDPLPFYVIYLTYMKDAFTNQFRVCRGINAQHCLVSMNNVWIMTRNLAPLWQNSLKLLNIYIINCEKQRLMSMTLI